MIIISIIAGLLSSMNVWCYDYNDIRFHINDVYMSLLMASWMLFFQTIIYYKHIKNSKTWLIASIIGIISCIILIRYQYFVTDNQYLSGMIPHHSMAILMSERILEKTNNKQIQKLANNIIISQKEEIQQMNNIFNTN